MNLETLTAIEELVMQVIAEAAKPGVMSLAGQRCEAKCAKQLVVYFKLIAARVKQAGFEKLLDLSQTAAKQAAEMKAKQIVRRSSDSLHNILKANYHAAMLIADAQTVVKEADTSVTVGPASGLLSSDAEQYASDQAASQIVGINQTSVDAIAELVATAVGNQFTPSELSSNLRDLLDGWTKNRTDLIARQEMADAFGAAAMMRLERNDTEYMQLINSPDACPICQDIADDGPVRVEDGFGDGEYARSPIHIGCRCATVGARAPQGDL